MKYIVLGLVAGLIAIFLWGMSSSRATDMVCGPTALVLGHAKDKYHEEPMFNGQTLGGQSVVMTMSSDGNWTMYMVKPGQLCGIAAGKLSAGVPIPDAKPKTSAPMLLPNGLRMIRG